MRRCPRRSSVATLRCRGAVPCPAAGARCARESRSVCHGALAARTKTRKNGAPWRRQDAQRSECWTPRRRRPLRAQWLGQLPSELLPPARAWRARQAPSRNSYTADVRAGALTLQDPQYAGLSLVVSASLFSHARAFHALCASIGVRLAPARLCMFRPLWRLQFAGRRGSATALAKAATHEPAAEDWRYGASNRGSPAQATVTR